MRSEYPQIGKDPQCACLHCLCLAITVYISAFMFISLSVQTGKLFCALLLTDLTCEESFPTHLRLRIEGGVLTRQQLYGSALLATRGQTQFIFNDVTRV